MRITVNISEETFRQYARMVDIDIERAAQMLAFHIRTALLRELRHEVSCKTEVVQTKIDGE